MWWERRHSRRRRAQDVEGHVRHRHSRWTRRMQGMGTASGVRPCRVVNWERQPGQGPVRHGVPHQNYAFAMNSKSHVLYKIPQVSLDES